MKAFLVTKPIALNIFLPTQPIIFFTPFANLTNGLVIAKATCFITLKGNVTIVFTCLYAKLTTAPTAFFTGFMIELASFPIGANNFSFT